MRKILILGIAVILNALGQSLMAQTEFGMTAWGMASVNVNAYLDITLGTAFIILSIGSYLFAVLLRKKFILKEMIESFLFLFLFGAFTDVFIYLIPNMSTEPILIRFIVNLTGLLILLFSISLHLKVNRAIHPMDVYLREIQHKVKSIRYGTYIAYGSAFVIGTIFGLLNKEILGINVGTIYTLLLSGIIFDFYSNHLLKNVQFEEELK